MYLSLSLSQSTYAHVLRHMKYYIIVFALHNYVNTYTCASQDDIIVAIPDPCFCCEVLLYRGHIGIYSCSKLLIDIKLTVFKFTYLAIDSILPPSTSYQSGYTNSIMYMPFGCLTHWKVTYLIDLSPKLTFLVNHEAVALHPFVCCSMFYVLCNYFSIEFYSYIYLWSW